MSCCGKTAGGGRNLQAHRATMHTFGWILIQLVWTLGRTEQTSSLLQPATTCQTVKMKVWKLWGGGTMVCRCVERKVRKSRTLTFFPHVCCSISSFHGHFPRNINYTVKIKRKEEMSVNSSTSGSLEFIENFKTDGGFCQFAPKRWQLSQNNWSHLKRRARTFWRHFHFCLG